jgi:hypothetical protein
MERSAQRRRTGVDDVVTEFRHLPVAGDSVMKIIVAVRDVAAAIPIHARS